MADIARETGLTLGTVSRALNTEGKYAIAPETRDRVMQTATRLGYRPNRIGQALAAGSASLVLLISPDPFAPYYVELSRHLSKLAGLQGFSFVTGGTLPISGSSGIPANDWLYGVDGMIVCDYLTHQEAYVAEALRLKIPIVGLGVRHPFPTDFVKVDLYSATHRLLNHMFESGCQHLAMMGSPGTDPSDPRTKAYLEVCEARQVPVTILTAANQSKESGRKAIHDSFKAHQPIDGLFCENDVIAVGAYRGLTDLGIQVPKDVMIAGCDGLDETIYQYTPITTIVQPLEEMSKIAWNMLQARIEGSTEPPRTQEVFATLDPRASTSK